MGTYEYEEIDGEKVETHVAAAFDKMAAAFKAHFGLTLHVRSGMRTDAEQQALYNAGRTKARPGQSDHNESGPNGPVALDLYDSGKDAGVKYIGTVRSNWLKRIAGSFQFYLDGATFQPPEGWHYKFTGKLTDAPAPTSTTVKTPVPDTSPVANKFGLDNVEGLQKIANIYTKGTKTKIDNKWGPLSEAGFDEFLQQKYGDSHDKGLARWLRDRWGYEGNDVYGPKMKSALVRANAANNKAL